MLIDISPPQRVVWVLEHDEILVYDEIVAMEEA
jgi:hypothetical protein